MGKMNVYVPDELQKAMKARRYTNWSKIAQRAFEAELAKPERDFLLVATVQTHHRRAGLARTEKLSPERRSEIARMGAAKRWERRRKEQKNGSPPVGADRPADHSSAAPGPGHPA